MKFSTTFAVCALLGAMTFEEAQAVTRHHHHNYVQLKGEDDQTEPAPKADAKAAPAEAAGEEAPGKAEAKAEVDEAVKEKEGKTAEEVVKDAKEILEPKKMKVTSEFEL